eukprot:COSAG06_NODE_628_length_13649_cov_20.848930_3_plen_225_part_00
MKQGREASLSNAATIDKWHKQVDGGHLSDGAKIILVGTQMDQEPSPGVEAEATRVAQEIGAVMFIPTSAYMQKHSNDEGPGGNVPKLFDEAVRSAIYEQPLGALRAVQTLHSGSVMALAWDSGSRTLFSGSMDQSVKVWREADGSFADGFLSRKSRRASKARWRESSRSSCTTWKARMAAHRCSTAFAACVSSFSHPALMPQIPDHLAGSTSFLKLSFDLIRLR